MLVFSFTRFVSNRHSPMSAERREAIAEGGSSGKSTPNWSRMEEGGGTERGSTGEHIWWRINGVNAVKLVIVDSNVFSITNIFLWDFCMEGFLGGRDYWVPGEGGTAQENTTSIFIHIAQCFEMVCVCVLVCGVSVWCASSSARDSFMELLLPELPALDSIYTASKPHLSHSSFPLLLPFSSSPFTSSASHISSKIMRQTKKGKR